MIILIIFIIHIFEIINLLNIKYTNCSILMIKKFKIFSLLFYSLNGKVDNRWEVIGHPLVILSRNDILPISKAWEIVFNGTI